MNRTLLRLAGLAILAACGAVLFAWSGLYSVAATRGHFPAVRWFLHYAMERSVWFHTLATEAPPLGHPAQLRLAAGHYATGCEPCHGGPGVLRHSVPLQMLPQPPKLEDAVVDFEAKELFWIVRHGLKYTGMPAWPAPERDDEVWAMAAFLKALPDMSPATYRELAEGEAAAIPGASNEASFGDTDSTPLDACIRCHGRDGTGDPSGAFPRLDIQAAPYLARALKDYAAGLRPSGVMEPMAHGLGERQMLALADHYSDAEGRLAGAERPDVELVARGQAIATGESASGIPACASCHGLDEGPANAVFPSLAGQYPSFIANQLRLWKEGVRGEGAYSRIMMPVARMLDEDQIEAVAAFYGSLSPADPEAARSTPGGAGGAETSR